MMRNSIYLITRRTRRLIECAKFIVGFVLLGIAAYTDYKTRTAPNWIWAILIVCAVVFFSVDLYLGLADYITVVAIVGQISLFYVLFQLHVLEGGADAKALICLAILIPYFVIEVLLIAVLSGLILALMIILKRRDLTLKTVFTKYPFPFLVALFIGYVWVYIISDGWHVVFVERWFS